ncbi:MAG: hypothetical protein J0L86_14410 [Flavobacteriales bacterium]|nr:hypothetical protein [Flavobacteriales bacterium]
MKRPIITIPKPCSENWSAMTPVEQGRFCQSCQKKVFDFTQSSDREIAKAFERNGFLCGRFSESQLNRELIVPKEKSSIWLATTSAVISFMGLGTEKIVAQEQPKSEQTSLKISSTYSDLIDVRGEIISYESEKLSDVLITVNGKNNVVYSDAKGKFAIKIERGDTLKFTKKDFVSQEISFDSEKGHYIIYMDEQYQLKSTYTTIVGGAISVGCKIEKKGTFLGRIFRSIGCLFRKK